jgi:hypothetical protein
MPSREPGLKAGQVVGECRKAREVRVTAGWWFVGMCAVLSLLNAPVGLSTLLLVVIVGTAARSGVASRARVAQLGCLAWFAASIVIALLIYGVAFLWTFFGSGTSLVGDPYGTSGTSFEPYEEQGRVVLGLVMPSWLAVLILVVGGVVIGCWVRAQTNTALRRIRSQAGTPSGESGVGDVPVGFHSGFTPFVGAGVPFHSWPLTLKLLPAQAAHANGHADAEQARRLAGSALVERAYDRLRRELPRLGEAEGLSNSTRREVEVADCVFLPGVRQDNAGEVVRSMVEGKSKRLRPERVKDFVDVSHERARHFLEVGVSMWDSQVVVTVFVRLVAQEGLLHVEGETLVMPPVSPAYQVPSGPLETGEEIQEIGSLIWRSLLALPQDLQTNAAEVLASRGSRRELREDDEAYTWAREHGEFFDYAPRTGIRERAATDDLRQLFQAHDVRRVTRAIPEKVLVCVRDVLREEGYDTEQVARIIQNIDKQYNQTFEQGSVQGHNVGVNEPTFDQRAMPSDPGPAGAGNQPSWRHG